MIDHLCINPILRIGLTHESCIDSRKLKWSVKVNVLLSNCKQNITSLSLLVDTTVPICFLLPSAKFANDDEALVELLDTDIVFKRTFCLTV